MSSTASAQELDKNKEATGSVLGMGETPGWGSMSMRQQIHHVRFTEFGDADISVQCGEVRTASPLSHIDTLYVCDVGQFGSCRATSHPSRTDVGVTIEKVDSPEADVGRHLVPLADDISQGYRISFVEEPESTPTVLRPGDEPITFSFNVQIINGFALDVREMAARHRFVRRRGQNGSSPFDNDLRKFERRDAWSQTIRGNTEMAVLWITFPSERFLVADGYKVAVVDAGGLPITGQTARRQLFRAERDIGFFVFGARNGWQISISWEPPEPEPTPSRLAQLFHERLAPAIADPRTRDLRRKRGRVRQAINKYERFWAKELDEEDLDVSVSTYSRVEGRLIPIHADETLPEHEFAIGEGIAGRLFKTGHDLLFWRSDDRTEPQHSWYLGIPGYECAVLVCVAVYCGETVEGSIVAIVSLSSNSLGGGLAEISSSQTDRSVREERIKSLHGQCRSLVLTEVGEIVGWRPSQQVAVPHAPVEQAAHKPGQASAGQGTWRRILSGGLIAAVVALVVASFVFDWFELTLRLQVAAVLVSGGLTFAVFIWLTGDIFRRIAWSTATALAAVAGADRLVPIVLTLVSPNVETLQPVSDAWFVMIGLVCIASMVLHYLRVHRVENKRGAG